MGDLTMAAVGVTEKEPLTRARILGCALALIDRDGLESLSMRKLAAQLGVAPMSLYNHIPGKDALLEGVTETLLAEIDISLPEDGWAETLRSAVLSFRRVLLDHPHAVPLIESKRVMTPAALRPVEFSLSLFRGAGFSPDDALSAHWAIVGFTLGHVTFQISNPLTEVSPQEALARSGELPAQQFPCYFEVLPKAASCDYDAAFDFGLDILIQGLQAKLNHRFE
jgi:AcrR family transcriptional regulator